MRIDMRMDMQWGCAAHVGKLLSTTVLTSRDVSVHMCTHIRMDLCMDMSRHISIHMSIHMSEHIEYDP